MKLSTAPLLAKERERIMSWNTKLQLKKDFLLRDSFRRQIFIPYLLNSSSILNWTINELMTILIRDVLLIQHILYIHWKLIWRCNFRHKTCQKCLERMRLNNKNQLLMIMKVVSNIPYLKDFLCYVSLAATPLNVLLDIDKIYKGAAQTRCWLSLIMTSAQCHWSIHNV